MSKGIFDLEKRRALKPSQSTSDPAPEPQERPQAGAESPPSPVVGERAPDRVWWVTGYGLPRLTVKAPNEEFAARYFRDHFGINHFRPDSDLTITLAE